MQNAIPWIWKKIFKLETMDIFEGNKTNKLLTVITNRPSNAKELFPKNGRRTCNLRTISKSLQRKIRNKIYYANWYENITLSKISGFNVSKLERQIVFAISFIYLRKKRMYMNALDSIFKKISNDYSVYNKC